MAENNEEKGKKKIWDKVLMGAVIGGAIGSVVGGAVAPKKAGEKETEHEAPAKKEKFIIRILRKVLKRKPAAKKIPNEEA